MSRNAWHMLDIEQVCNRLETHSAKGLARKQAVARAKKLNNRHPEALQPLFIPAKRPYYRDLAKLLLDPIMLLTLFVAAMTVFFDEHVLLGCVTVALLVINVFFCAIANAKVREVHHKLRLYSNPMAKIVRSGKLFTTDARNVLPGDLVILSSGDICPADIRLEKGSHVRVSQYTFGSGAEKFVRVSVEKSGDRVYLPDQEVFHPNCENIVYAGSVIERGFAKGIAVGTGRHTFIGAVNGTVPGTEHAAEPESIVQMKRYFSRSSLVHAILLVPLTVVLIVTMRESLTFAEAFLTALALCCTVVTERIVCLAGIVRAAGIDAAASERQNASVAIVKSSDASDKLCEMTDLLLLDSAALSDGKYHLESVYACGSIYNQNELLNEDVQQLVKDLYLYRSATRPPEADGRDAFDAGLTAPIDALIKYVGADTAAIDLVRERSVLSFASNICTVRNQLNNGEYDVLLSQDEQLLQMCTHVATGQMQKEFDDSEHIAIRTLCRIYRESGYRILLLANRSGERVTSMGVLAFAQKAGFQFCQCCEQLMSGGVRVSVFMPDSAESMKILTDCALVRNENNDVLTLREAMDQGLDLHVAYGSYRAYLGFSDAQIAELIEKLKQRGNRVATYCVDNQAQPLQDLSDLAITCDAIEYRSPKVSEALYDKMPVDGRPFSSRASQNMRRNSGVILRRAGDQGGGLHGILSGRRYAFSINCNLANAMTYLITMQIFRAVLLCMPAVFGTYMLSSVALLISGLVLDVAAVMFFAFAMPSEKARTPSYSMLRRLEKPISYNAANVVSACLSALLLWLGFSVLQIFELADASQSAGLGFLSVYLLQGVVFTMTLREYTAEKKKGYATALYIAVAAYLVLPVLFACIPLFNALVGLHTYSWWLVPVSAFAPLLYAVTYRILSARGLNLHK